MDHHSERRSHIIIEYYKLALLSPKTVPTVIMADTDGDRNFYFGGNEERKMACIEALKYSCFANNSRMWSADATSMVFKDHSITDKAVLYHAAAVKTIKNALYSKCCQPRSSKRIIIQCNYSPDLLFCCNKDLKSAMPVLFIASQMC